MRVLVTGASGFIGPHVVVELVAAGHRVATLHRGPALAVEGVEHTAADVLSESARAAAHAADAVVHLAGQGDVQASFTRPFEYNRLNALGTLNVLEGARGSGAHVALASTQRVYRASDGPLKEDAPLEPTDPYAVSKLIAERWCRMYAELLDVPTTVVRLFSVYGPGQVGQGTSGVVSIFLARALRNEPLVVQAVQRRDLTDVSDVARGIRLAIEQPPPAGGSGVPPASAAGARPASPPGGTSAVPGARVYNLATGVGTTLEELARLVCQVVDSRSAIVPPDNSAVEGDRVADVSRARVDLGYLPTVSLEDGLRRMVSWAREHPAPPPGR